MIGQLLDAPTSERIRRPWTAGRKCTGIDFDVGIAQHVPVKLKRPGAAEVGCGRFVDQKADHVMVAVGAKGAGGVDMFGRHGETQIAKRIYGRGIGAANVEVAGQNDVFPVASGNTLQKPRQGLALPDAGLDRV